MRSMLKPPLQLLTDMMQGIDAPVPGLLLALYQGTLVPLHLLQPPSQYMA